MILDCGAIVQLRSQTLVLSKLEKGEKSFPQVPSASEELTQNSEPTHERKKTRTENCKNEPLPQSNEPCGRNEWCDAEIVNMMTENEEEVELPPSPLLGLCNIPSTTHHKNQLPAIIQQGYASAAEFVKKALISEFTSRDNFDVESMVHLAKDVFVSLASLHADYAGLYDLVREFILYHWQLSVAKKELERNGCLWKMEAYHSYLYDQSDKALKALPGVQISLAKPEKQVTSIATKIVETRELLKELEQKLKQGNEKLYALQEECDRLEKSYEAAKSEEQNAAKKIEEHKKIVEPISSGCDKAMVDIERTKVLLSSLCELNNGHS